MTIYYTACCFDCGGGGAQGWAQGALQASSSRHKLRWAVMATQQQQAGWVGARSGSGL